MLKRRYVPLIASLLIALGTGLSSRTLQLSVVETTVLILLQVVLGISVEILIRMDDIASSPWADIESILAHDPWLSELFREVIAGYGNAKSYKNELLQIQTRHLLEELRQDMHRLGAGEIRVNLEPHYFLREPNMINGARREVIATSMVDGESYWMSEWGEKYNRRNKVLTDKGISIIRVFIESRATMHTLRKVVDRQVSDGVDVRIAVLEEVPRHLASDYMVIDNNVLCRLILRDRLPAAEEIFLSESPRGRHEIERAKMEFRQLLDYCRKPEEFWRLFADDEDSGV